MHDRYFYELATATYSGRLRSWKKGGAAAMLTLDDVIYMIVTDRFADGDPGNNFNVDLTDPFKRHGGDLAGIVDRLAYLAELGVTVLWITPVYLNPPDSYHGYHPLDFERIDPHLCSPTCGDNGDGQEALRTFVEKAHEQGLKVLLDLVVSHTAEGHPWVTQRPEWIDWHGTTVEKEWFKGLPNINHDNLDANVYFVLNVLDWIIETGVDAVRIDAARHIESRFWQYFKLYSQGLFPGTTVVGEFWDSDPHCVAPFQNLHGFHSMFDFPLYHAIRDVFIGDQDFNRLVRARLSDHESPGILDLDAHYRNAYQLITFIGNHDAPRFFEAAGGADNPEQAIRRMKLALVFLMTSRGIPQLYYGDELAMAGGYDPDNRRDMTWERLDPAVMTDEARRARDMLSFTRRLIQLRRQSPALCWGMWSVLYVTPSLLVFVRFALDDVVIVCLNKAATGVDVFVPVQSSPHIPELMREKLIEGLELCNQLAPEDRPSITRGGLSLKLAGYSAAIYRARLPVLPGTPRRHVARQVDLRSQVLARV